MKTTKATTTERAISLILSGNVAISTSGNVRVKSQNGGGFYRVDLRRGYSCECPAYGAKAGMCKHAIAAHLVMTALREAGNESNEIVDIQAALGMMNEDGYAIAYKALAFMGRPGYERPEGE